MSAYRSGSSVMLAQGLVAVTGIRAELADQGLVQGVTKAKSDGLGQRL